MGTQGASADASAAGERLRGLTEDIAELVRLEVTRVRDDLLVQARAVGVDAGLLGAAGAAGLASLVAGTIAIIDGLHGGTPPRSRGLPVWLAATATSALAAGGAVALVTMALRDLRRRRLMPDRALEQLELAADTAVSEVRLQT